MKPILQAATFSLTLMLGSASALAAAAPAQPAPVPAASAVIPDFSKCPVLRDEKAYAKKLGSYQYLLQGKNGWVFRTQADFKTDFTMTKKGVVMIKRLSDMLKARGTDLVIAYIPTRGMAAEASVPAGDPLIKGFSAATARKNYGDYIAAMNKAGVRIVGTPAMKSGEGYFYKADQHWSDEGAKEMAQAVAAYVKTLPSYKDIKKVSYKTSIVSKDSFEGTFNEALDKMCNFKMPNEQGVEAKTEPVSGTLDASSLFGAQNKPSIVLVGTSNSKKDQNDANFEGSLKEALSADVYNAAITGGGLDDSLVAYLSSPDFVKTPPKVLIWEMPGYYNLEGEDARKVLRQVVPILYGECKAPLAASGPVKLTEQQPVVLKDLKSKNITGDKLYLHLGFDQPVKKNFTVTFFDANKGRQSVRFSRTQLYPYSGAYYYMPKGVVPLDAVGFKIPKEMIGYTATLSLCAVPDQARPAAAPKK